ncbi:MAG: hypothetical protein ACREUW_11125 [Burkholderiales bacterium]
MELPKIFSDDEFESAQKQQSDKRLQHDRWDPAGMRAPPPPTDGKPECALEQSFPHICRKLASLWGTDVCGLYLKGLIVSDRETRKGFPLDIVEDLLMLYIINEIVTRKVGFAPPPRIS